MKKTIAMIVIMGLLILSGCGKNQEKNTETYMSYVTGGENTGNITGQEVAEEVCSNGIFYAYYDFISKKKYAEAYAMKDTTETFDEFNKANKNIKKVDIINTPEEKSDGVNQFRIAVLSSDGTIGEYSIRKKVIGCKIKDIDSWKLPNLSFYTTMDELCSLSGNKQRYIFDQTNKEKILVYEYPTMESLIKTGNNIYYSFQENYGECNTKNQEYVEHYDCIIKEKKILLKEQAECYGSNRIIYPIDIQNIYILSIIGDGCGVAENYIVSSGSKQKIDFSTFQNYKKIATARYLSQKNAEAKPSCYFDTIGGDLTNMNMICRYSDVDYNFTAKGGETICGKNIKFTADIVGKIIK